MISEDKKRELGEKLVKITEELQMIAKETDSCVDVYVQGKGKYDGMSVYIHYGDGDDKRMVAIDKMDDVKDAFLIERDDTIRKENEDGKDNAEG